LESLKSVYNRSGEDGLGAILKERGLGKIGEQFSCGFIERILERLSLLAYILFYILNTLPLHGKSHTIA